MQILYLHYLNEVVFEFPCKIVSNELGGYNIGFQDNVFVNVVASIQFCALPDKVGDAFYKLTNVNAQIKAYVFDGKQHCFLYEC